jgi:transposase
MADRKQTFTPEFRAEAVRLARTSGQSRRDVAADLGVGLSTLRNWIDGRRERGPIPLTASGVPAMPPTPVLCR